MAGKIQLPAIGGLRKVIKVAASGTTIAEFGTQSITLAQLKTALGVSSSATQSGASASGSGSTGATAAISPGVGLAGGGPLVGAVPLRVIAPIPAFIWDDGGGGDGDPGPPGTNGIIGVNGLPGPPGPAVLFIDEGPEGEQGPPGSNVGPPGAQGTTGLTGNPGPAGPAVYLVGDDGADGDPGPPGVSAASTSSKRLVNKGANWVSSSAIVASSTNVVYVQCPVAGTITATQVVTSGGPGSCVIDVWKAAFASFPPTSANSITASHKPTISAGNTYSDSTLTGWTTAINAGDVLAFSLTSASTFTQIQIILEVSQ